MKPRFITRKGLESRAWVLWFLSAGALGYWFKWWAGESHIVIPMLLTAAGIGVAWQSRYPKQVVLLCLSFYAGIAVLKGLLWFSIGRDVITPIIAFGIVLAIWVAVELLFPGKESTQWVWEEGLGDEDFHDLRLDFMRRGNDADKNPTET